MPRYANAGLAFEKCSERLNSAMRKYDIGIADDCDFADSVADPHVCCPGIAVQRVGQKSNLRKLTRYDLQSCVCGPIVDNEGVRPILQNAGDTTRNVQFVIERNHDNVREHLVDRETGEMRLATE